ncbi:hypothetical protein [Nitratidesulfovibrio sp.]|uniref:hypothetical protein n=1 Tax=Nitratidesulfovibrio sp. TaxID=2802297 RepID=UPI0033416413
MARLPWSDFYATPFVEAPDCWKTCGGYCCANFTQLNSGGSVVVPFLAQEYGHYAALAGPEGTAQVSHHAFTLPDGSPLTVHLLRCKRQGLCTPWAARPLICRIYPYLPVVDLHGTVTDFDACSLADAFYRHPAASHRCTLVREQADAIRPALKDALRDMLAYPEMIFSFLLLHLVLKHLRMALPQHVDTLSDDEFPAFRTRFNSLLFTQRPWRTPAFADDVAAMYAACVALHGPLDLSLQEAT